MIYRPQFKYPTPPGYRDVSHEYYMNIFTDGIAAGATSDWRPFQLDDDAPFLCRALTGDFNNGSLNAFINLRDPWNRNLFSDLVLIETVIGGLAGPAYVLNEEYYCPPSAIWQVQVKNPTNGTIFPVAILRGVKRCLGCAA